MRPHIKITLIFTLLVISTVLISGCNKPEQAQHPVAEAGNQPENKALELIAADLVAVKTGTLAQKTAFTGALQAVHQTSIQTQVSATVLEVHAEVGQAVNKGQTLVRLNNQDNAARLAQARANLASAQAQSNLNLSLVERKRRLFEQGFIAKLELEQSQVEYRAQQENVKAQQASVDIAVKASQDAVISSPISGYVTKRQVDRGQTVAIGQTLFEIVDPTRLEIKANLAASDRAKIHPGQSVSFHVQGSDQSYQAKVTRISPVADSMSRNIEFFAEPDSALSRLSIGAFVEGEIVQNSAQQGHLIPLSTIQNPDKNPMVWVIRDQKIQHITVDVLQIDRKQEIALVKGLQDTDQVSLVRFNPQDQNRRVNIEK